MSTRSKTRIAAVILLIAFVATALFSAAFAARHARHDCVGPGCGVCCLIGRSLTRLCVPALLAAVLAAGLLSARAGMNGGPVAFAAVLLTPVSLKVKLSD